MKLFQVSVKQQIFKAVLWFVSVFLCTHFFTFYLSPQSFRASFSQPDVFFSYFFVNGWQYVITWAELFSVACSCLLHTHCRHANGYALSSSNTYTHTFVSAHLDTGSPRLLIHTKCKLGHTCAHINTGLPSWKCAAAAVYPVETRKTSCTVLRVKTSPHIINTSPRHSLKLHFGWFLWPSRQRSPAAVQLDRQFGDLALLNILDFLGTCAVIRLLYTLSFYVLSLTQRQKTKRTSDG